jgi:hypothetical protein
MPRDRRREEVTHDDLIKGLLLCPRLLREFFRAFLPELGALVELDGLQYVDKEHPRAGAVPRRTGDVLVKAKWIGSEAAMLMHMEVQSRAHPCLTERLVQYAMRDALRYRLPVLPVLLLTAGRPAEKFPGVLDWRFGKSARVHARCPVVAFRQLRPEKYLRSRNVAALALTSLMPLTPSQQVDAIVQTLAESLRQRLAPDELEAATAFVTHYLPLGSRQALQVEAAVRKLSETEPELAAMPKLVNPFVQIGRIRGREEGREEGVLEGWLRGSREMSLRLVERKFPGLGKRVSPLLSRLGSNEVIAFGEALLFMNSPRECLAWLRRACGHS